MDRDSHDSEHLSPERISALLDEPDGDAAAAEHLERCEQCERERERMRRMRMALSALGGVEPPEDEWERVEPYLPEADVGAAGQRDLDDVIPLFPSGWAAGLAAATLVFAVGLGAGLQLRDGGTAAGDGGPGAAGPRAERPATGASGPDASPRRAAGEGRLTAGVGDRAGGGSRVYLSVARSLDEMVSTRADTALTPIADPMAAAEEMARLEAMAEAAREALRDRPADPALNNFLFRVNERQEALRSRLGAAARLASMEYR